MQVDDGNSEDVGSSQRDIIPEPEDGEEEEDDRIMYDEDNW